MSSHPGRGLARSLLRGSVLDLAAPGAPIFPARGDVAAPAVWRLSTFAGRLGEICGGRDSAVLTLTFRLVLEAQREGEPTAWITRRDHWFYPPDAAEVGVDLAALVVVQVDGGLAGVQAADHLLRSGAFGLVVLDLGPDLRPSIAVQARLGGLAKRHRTAVLFLTDAGRQLGSLISIRAEAVRTREEEDRFRCRARILKDKRHGPGGGHAEVYRGPDGLR